MDSGVGRREIGRRRALGLACALAGAALAGCIDLTAADDPQLRIDRAVDDARDPVERGGERAVPRSGQLLDEMRLRPE